MSLLRKKTATPEEQAFQAAISEQFDRAEHGPGDEEEIESRASAASDGDGDTESGPVLDFGALRVPAVDGMQVRAELDGQEQVVGVAVVLQDTMLQLQAFAAPRSEDLWDEVRQEIAEGIRGGQGKAREVDGPFGRELQAEVVVTDESGGSSRQPVRFIGTDGERWFLRGVVTGPGATDPASAAAIEQIFSGVEVERGAQAAAPRDLLPLTLPTDQLLDSEAGGVDDPTEA
ncbi:MAG: DUF3710 domain-containing protein [Actinomycetia bacterium]|nr:DUF3710 domain-containing protein [Actinomycetes bacterium]